MALSNPSLPPCGLLKYVVHWSNDWKLFIKLLSKPLVEAVMSSRVIHA